MLSTKNLLFAFMTVAAIATAQELLPTTIDVSANREFVIMSSIAPSHVNAIACRVLAPVFTVGGVSISTTIDGVLSFTTIYERGTNVWTEAISTFQTVGSPFNSGYNVGDTFRIPINRSYSRARISILTFGGSGRLVCTVAK